MTNKVGKFERYIFIVNPVAGKHRGRELESIIVTVFPKAEFLETQYPGHASELAKKHAGQGVLIFSVGGDGTFNEVINGIMQSDFSRETVVANVPCGSGNDFIKGFTDEKNATVLIKSYKHAQSQPIDVACLNGRFFVNISSVGFDAEIVEGAKRFKKLPLVSAELAYLISVFYNLIKLRGYGVKVKVDNEEVWDDQALFVTMANGKYYGGGMKVAPTADFSDGVLDFNIMEKVKRRQVFKYLPKYMKGKHEHLDIVTRYRGKTLEIESEESLPINIDGEVVRDAKVKVRVIADGLNVLRPEIR